MRVRRSLSVFDDRAYDGLVKSFTSEGVVKPPECTECGLPPLGSLSEEQLARIAKGLAHPTRVRIIEQFSAGRPRMVQDIAAECTLAQSTVSEHLRILRDADLLFARKDGPRMWYCLRRSVLGDFLDAVRDLAVVD